MPLPNYVLPTDIFFTWLDATNNLTSHVSNTSAYILVAQNATPQVSVGNVAINGTVSANTLSSLSVYDSLTINAYYMTLRTQYPIISTSHMLLQNDGSGGSADLMVTANFDDEHMYNGPFVIQSIYNDMVLRVSDSGGNLILGDWNNWTGPLDNYGTYDYVGSGFGGGDIILRGPIRVRGPIILQAHNNDGTGASAGTLNDEGGGNTLLNTQLSNTILEGQTTFGPPGAIIKTTVNATHVITSNLEGNGSLITGLNANNLTSGVVLSVLLPVANATANGIVTTGTQRFAGNKTFESDVTITGNLTLIGQATNVNVTNLVVTDSLIQLASNNTTSDALDIGIFGNYNPNGGAHEHTGLFRDATDGVWKLFDGLQEMPNTTVNTVGTGYAVGTLQSYLTSAILGTNTSALVITANSSYSATLTVNAVAAQTITGNLTGDVTGTTSNATNLNSQPGSFYTNASNLSTGIVPLARLSAANTIANGVITTTTQTFAGTKTFQNVVSVSDNLLIGGDVRANVIYGYSLTLRANGEPVGQTPPPPDLWIESTQGSVYVNAVGTIYHTSEYGEVRLNGHAALVYGNTGGTFIGSGSSIDFVIGPLSAYTTVFSVNGDAVGSIVEFQAQNTVSMYSDVNLSGNILRILPDHNTTGDWRLQSIDGIPVLAEVWDSTLTVEVRDTITDTAHTVTFATDKTTIPALTSLNTVIETSLAVGNTQANIELTEPGVVIDATGITVYSADRTKVSSFTADEVTTTNVSAINLSGNGSAITSLNASALSTGTVPLSRLDANVILTTSTTGINASALSTGTVPLARLTDANTTANGVVTTIAQTFAGVKTFQNAVSMQSTATVNGTLTLTTTAGLSANGSLGTAGQLLYSNGSTVYWATPTYASPDDVIALAIALG